MKRPLSLLTLCLASAAATVGTEAQTARDYISIVGSSTVYPFSTVVAEQFGKTSSFKTPKVEATGSGGGLKLFCSGVGVSTPDIANASRRIKASEVDRCASHGVDRIVEVKIGYDGIVLANSKKAGVLELSRRDIYLALAREVPAPGGDGGGSGGGDGGNTFVANPYRTWNDVNPALPAMKIAVLGPPPTSGTRDAFVELAMEGGCNTFASIAAMKKRDSGRYKSICHAVREDGAYIEAGENDNLIVQKLDADPDTLGIFGFSFLDQNSDKVQGARVDGVEPSFEDIAQGRYPISRPLYFYAKAAHIGKIPGMREYLSEFTSEKAWGDDGYLADKGMIPMPVAERNAYRGAVQRLENLSLSTR